MNKDLTVQKQPKPLKALLEADLTRNKFKEVLGKKAPGFIASILSVVNNNELLAKTDPKSILSAAMIAATLDLPINENLGYAYIIPYKNGKTGIVTAQFQMGWKGFVQLAQRSGQFKTINVTDVREGEIKNIDRLTGEISFNWSSGDREKLPVIGYVAYMHLVNGFEKMLYMTKEQLKSHGLRYSQTMKKGFGLWKDEFDVMASKTVVKLLLSKYAPLTTEMQQAALADQAIIENDGEMKYIDNEPVSPEEVANEKERERILKFIKKAKTLGELEKVQKYIDGDKEVDEAFQNRKLDFEKASLDDIKPEDVEK